MHTAKNNTSSGNSRAIANTLGSGEDAYAEVKRETSLTQSKMQEIADNSPQVRKGQQYQAMANNAAQPIQHRIDLKALEEKRKEAEEHYRAEKNKTRERKLLKATREVAKKEDEINQEQQRLTDFRVSGPANNEQQERAKNNVSAFVAAATQSSSRAKQQPHGNEASLKEQYAVRIGNDKHGSGDAGHTHFRKEVDKAAEKRSIEGIQREDNVSTHQQNLAIQERITQLKK